MFPRIFGSLEIVLTIAHQKLFSGR